MPTPKVDWSLSEAPNELEPDDQPPGPPSDTSAPWRRLLVMLAFVAVVIGFVLWLSTGVGKTDHVALDPTATAAAPTIMHTVGSPATQIAAVTPTRPTATPSSTAVPPPSPTAWATPVIAQFTTSLGPTAAAARIAFVFRHGNGDDIYTVRADGTGLVNVSNHAELGLWPVWSPDGLHLAFISDRSGQLEIYLVQPDGADLRQLTHTPADLPGVIELAWSPDSKRLALSYALPPTSTLPFSPLELISVTGLTTTVLYRGERPQWSPDGRWLAYDGLGPLNVDDVFVASGNGAGARLLVNAQGEISGTSSLLTGFTWAPDSSQLAYILEGPLTGDFPNRQWGSGPLHAGLFTIRPDGSDLQLVLQIAPFPNALIGPSWSPDGRYLLYITNGDGECFDIHLFAVATRRDTTLHGVCYLPRTLMPDWSPDGRYLVFSAQPNSIVLLDVTNALQHANNINLGGMWLTAGPDLTMDPAWQPANQ